MSERQLKLFIIVFLSAITFSCNSDDNNSDTIDPFIGKWHFSDTIYILTDQSEFVETVSSCEHQSYYRFNTNGTVEIMSFYENGNSCIKEEVNISSFIWEKINDSNYRLKSIEIDGTESNKIINVVFETPNVMYWAEKFIGTTIDGDEFIERRSYFERD